MPVSITMVAPGYRAANASKHARVLKIVSSVTMSPASFKTHTVWRRSPTERDSAEKVTLPAWPGAKRRLRRADAVARGRPDEQIQSNREFIAGVHKT